MKISPLPLISEQLSWKDAGAQERQSVLLFIEYHPISRQQANKAFGHTKKRAGDLHCRNQNILHRLRVKRLCDTIYQGRKFNLSGSYWTLLFEAILRYAKAAESAQSDRIRDSAVRYDDYHEIFTALRICAGWQIVLRHKYHGLSWDSTTSGEGINTDRIHKSPHHLRVSFLVAYFIKSKKYHGTCDENETMFTLFKINHDASYILPFALSSVLNFFL